MLQLLFLALGQAKGITRQQYLRGFFKKREMTHFSLCTDYTQILSARVKIVANLFMPRISTASLLQRGCWMKKGCYTGPKDSHRVLFSLSRYLAFIFIKMPWNSSWQDLFITTESCPGVMVGLRGTLSPPLFFWPHLSLFWVGAEPYDFSPCLQLTELLVDSGDRRKPYIRGFIFYILS